MSTINLKIGNTDISEYVSPEEYSVRMLQKKSENSRFQKYDGTETSEVLGYYYELSANIELIPNVIAEQLAAVMAHDKFEAVFTDPFGSGTAEFLRSDSAAFEVACELDDGLYWNINISLKSELIKSGGGL